MSRGCLCFAASIANAEMWPLIPWALNTTAQKKAAKIHPKSPPAILSVIFRAEVLWFRLRG